MYALAAHIYPTEIRSTGVGTAVAVGRIGNVLAAYAAAMAWMLTTAAAGLVALTVFWAGVFLAWFGIRSHIESSILLRMLFMLRRSRLSDADIVAEYTRRHGESARLAELRRGGLIVGDAGRARVTPKGRAILSLASRLR
jgi:hypothetical protein